MSESRFYEVAYRGVSKTRNGRVMHVVGIRCPYCDVTTEAYVWPLAGSGKRCECGAVHRHHPGVTTKEKPL